MGGECSEISGQRDERGRGKGKKTETKMKFKNMEGFVHQFGQLIRYMYQLKHGEIYERVVADINKCITEGYSLTFNRTILEFTCYD